MVVYIEEAVLHWQLVWIQTDLRALKKTVSVAQLIAFREANISC